MPKRKKRDDNDTPWKKILRQYFPQAIEFFFPLVSEKIDWSKPCEFLDKEFQKIAPDAAQGNRYADKLVKVWLKDGRSTYLLLHVEIQAQKEEEFALRMLIYSIRIFDHFGSFATSLAILCDQNSAWRPQNYVLESPATRLAFEFGQVKLLDYREQWEALEQSENLFAPVVMAHLKTQETKRNPKQRKQWKFGLMRRLYEQGWSKQEIFYFYEFVDWVMILPAELEAQFWQELKQFEEVRKMRYVTNAERFALQEAEEKARLEVAQELLRMGMALENIASATKLSIEQIQQLQKSQSDGL